MRNQVNEISYLSLLDASYILPSTSYITYDDPILEFRIKNYPLIDEINYINIADEVSKLSLSIGKKRLFLSISLIEYKLESVKIDWDENILDVVSGIPEFSFEGMNDVNNRYFDLRGCKIRTYLSNNIFIIDLYSYKYSKLIWINWAQFYFGFYKNRFASVAYRLNESELKKVLNVVAEI